MSSGEGCERITGRNTSKEANSKTWEAHEYMEEAHHRVGEALKRFAASEREVVEANEQMNAPVEQDSSAAEQVRESRLFYHLVLKKLWTKKVTKGASEKGTGQHTASPAHCRAQLELWQQWPHQQRPRLCSEMEFHGAGENEHVQGSPCVSLLFLALLGYP